MAGSGQFSVELPTVTAAAGRVHQVNEQINGLLRNLDSRMQSVLTDPAVWRGESQTTFVAVHHQFDDAAKKINNALADIGNQLQASSTQYQSGDAQSRTVIAGAASGLA